MLTWAIILEECGLGLLLLLYLLGTRDDAMAFVDGLPHLKRLKAFLPARVVLVADLSRCSRIFSTNLLTTLIIIYQALTASDRA